MLVLNSTLIDILIQRYIICFKLLDGSIFYPLFITHCSQKFSHVDGYKIYAMHVVLPSDHINVYHTVLLDPAFLKIHFKIHCFSMGQG